MRNAIRGVGAMDSVRPSDSECGTESWGRRRVFDRRTGKEYELLRIYVTFLSLKVIQFPRLYIPNVPLRMNMDDKVDLEGKSTLRINSDRYRVAVNLFRGTGTIWWIHRERRHHEASFE